MPVLSPQKNTSKYKPVKSLSIASTSKAERMKYYSSKQWFKLRKAKLMDSPLCEVCSKAGRTTGAEHVHHIRSPFKVPDNGERASLFYDYDNLMSICSECHGKHHRLEQIKAVSK